MRPSSTKDMRETGMLRIFRQFSRMYKRGERQRADKMGERADPWLTPTFTSYVGEERLFHM